VPKPISRRQLVTFDALRTGRISGLDLLVTPHASRSGA
jgi:hypothetical protein